MKKEKEKVIPKLKSTTTRSDPKPHETHNWEQDWELSLSSYPVWKWIHPQIPSASSQRNIVLHSSMLSLASYDLEPFLIFCGIDSG